MRLVLESPHDLEHRGSLLVVTPRTKPRIVLVADERGGQETYIVLRRLVERLAHGIQAISGFDPAAYFSEAKPKIGSPDVELRLDGAVWRFQNVGNRAAFAAHPEVYMPRFGGYDPVAIARGTSVEGHPLIWVVIAERLYLFYTFERSWRSG